MRTRAVGWCLALFVLLGVLRSQDVLLRLNGAPGENFGHAVVGVGDTDLDGWVDLLVGAPDAGIGGEARLFSGRDGTLLRTLAGKSGRRLGEQVVALGDVDGDAHPDFAVADDGEVHVFSGRDGRTLFARPAGSGMARAGDVNGDGYADLVVGYVAKGTVIVYSGRDGSVLDRFVGDDPSDRFGVVGEGGDVDGDGHADVVIGAPGQRWSGTTSYARVFSGRTGAILFEFSGGPHDELGTAVTSGLDIDRDGCDEVVLFAPQDSPHLNNRAAGYCDVYSGRTGALLERQTGIVSCTRYGCTVVRRLTGPLFVAGDTDGDGVPDYRIGSSGARAGDLDRDGLDDIVIGFPADGYVEAYSGSSRTLLYTFTQPTPIGYGVQSAASLGDANGDGAPELVLGQRSGYWDQIRGVLSTVTVRSGRDGTQLMGFRSPGLGGSGPDVNVATAGAAGMLISWTGGQNADQLVQMYGLDRTLQGEWNGKTLGFSGFGRALVGGRDWNAMGYHPYAFASADKAWGDPVARGWVIGVPRGSAIGPSFSGDRDGDAFGAALAFADVNADGLADLVVGAPGGDANGVDSGYVRVWSSIDLRTPLYDLPGPGPGAAFGSSVSSAGDLDGDGHEDFAVSAAGAGLTRVLSGATATKLFDLPSGGPLQGSADFDGDGVPDLMVAGTVYSGRGGGSLAGFGSALLFADLTGDGRGEILVAGSGFPNGVQTLYVHTSAPRPRLNVFGHPCPGVRGFPALRLAGSALPGGVVVVEGVHLRASSPGALVIGASRDSSAGVPLPLPLAFAGMPACVLWSSLDVVLPVQSDANGSVRRSLAIPDLAGLVGASVYQQIVLLDADANPGGAVTSNAGLVHVEAR